MTDWSCKKRARHGCRYVKTANLRGKTSCRLGQWSEMTVTRAVTRLWTNTGTGPGWVNKGGQQMLDNELILFVIDHKLEQTSCLKQHCRSSEGNDTICGGFCLLHWLGFHRIRGHWLHNHLLPKCVNSVARYLGLREEQYMTCIFKELKHYLTLWWEM